MRLTLLATLLIAAVAVIALGAEKQDLAKVSLDRLVTETQQSLDSAEGFNLVWVIPIEYWETCFAQDDTVSPAQRKQMIDALDDYIMVGVVRANIGAFGGFRFHGGAAVRKSVKLVYRNSAGKETVLKAPLSVSADASMVLRVIKPILSQAMGNMGENFHIYLYTANDAAGKRIFSPYEKGVLRAELSRLGKDVAGTMQWEFPLDCLYVPRVCKPCTKEMHISWNYCPWCGVKLPK